MGNCANRSKFHSSWTPEIYIICMIICMHGCKAASMPREDVQNTKLGWGQICDILDLQPKHIFHWTSLSFTVYHLCLCCAKYQVNCTTLWRCCNFFHQYTQITSGHTLGFDNLSHGYFNLENINNTFSYSIFRKKSSNSPSNL